MNPLDVLAIAEVIAHEDATLRPYDEFRMTTQYVATCSRFRSVCAYWDAEDLDENGDLLHECEG